MGLLSTTTAQAPLGGALGARSPGRRQHELLDAALSYAARGWRILPLWWIRRDGTCAVASRLYGARQTPHGPSDTHGLNDASSDPDVIRKWWRACPDANWGGRCRRTWASSDVDPRHGGHVDALPLTWDQRRRWLQTPAAVASILS